MLVRGLVLRAYTVFGKRICLRSHLVHDDLHSCLRFDLNSNVGGACGEVAAYKGLRWTSLLNPLGKFSADSLASLRGCSQHWEQ
jgi:hypothetical protein